MKSALSLATLLLLVACASSTDPEGSLVVNGSAVLDGRPLSGAQIEVVELRSTRVTDSSIQGYHYEVTEIRLRTTQTDSNGGFAAELSVARSSCENGALIRMTWNAVRRSVGLPSPCGTYSGIDFRLVTDTITGDLTVNDEPVSEASVRVQEQCVFLLPCSGAVFDSTVTDLAGSFELTLVGCEHDRTYVLSAHISLGFDPAKSFEGCMPRRAISWNVSTQVEVSGTIYLDGTPVAGWQGSVVGMAEPCEPLVPIPCVEAVLSTALTDASGRFQLSHTAEGFQCAKLYLRAKPPEDWPGPLPVATNPPASGWERSCGSYSPVFDFATPG